MDQPNHLCCEPEEISGIYIVLLTKLETFELGGYQTPERFLEEVRPCRERKQNVHAIIGGIHRL